MRRACLVIVALAGTTAVGLGAFGAHGLAESLDARSLATYGTAVEYHFWHTLAIGLVAALVLPDSSWRSALGVAGVAFTTGIVLFSGSLYLLALGFPSVLGAIAPVGGLAFVVGWLAVGASAWKA